MSRVAKLSLLFLALIIGIVVLSTIKKRRFSCEVCVTFNGRTMCRTAAGDDRGATVRLAVDNACAFLARGRTEIMKCSNVQPDRVECTEP